MPYLDTITSILNDVSCS